MGMFFIETTSGAVATHRQLVEAGVITNDSPPALPWYRIQGSGDASTMWYAVMRKQEKGIFIGTLVIRHQDHHAYLMAHGWEEVPIPEIGTTVSA